MQSENIDQHQKGCFACTTPYQIMNAISIVYENLIDADIIIFDTFKGFEEIAKRLEIEGIFENVYTCNFYSTLKCRESRFASRLQCSLRFIIARKYFRSIIPERIIYKSFYSSSQAVPKMVLKRALDGRNPRMETVIYEDGTGTYSYGGRAFVGSSKFQFLQKMMRFKFLPDGRTTFMPRFPEIAPVLRNVKNYSIIPMPILQESENLVRQLSRIFWGKEKFTNISQKVIIFDNFRCGYSKCETMLDQIYDYISDRYKKDVICKPHPRSSADIKSSVEIYSECNVPMELMYMQMGNKLDEKIIFSVYSTASFTPLLMFGKTPILFFLYKMFFKEDSIQRCDLFIEKIKKISKARIYTPKDIREFKECLDKVELESQIPEI